MNPLGRAAELIESGAAFALATVTWRRGPTSGREGAKAIIHPDGRVEGWVGGACATPTLVREALEALRDGRPRLLVLGETDSRPGVTQVAMACESEGAMEVYVEPFFPSPHLWIIGSSPMAQVLASLAANVGWRVNITDDDDLSEAGAGSLVVVATQGHHDEPALEAALATGAAYIGLVASAKRASTVMEYLRQRGHDEVAVARIEAPAGIDLGGTSHEETAVAILAGLVATRNRRSTVATVIPAEAVDPICGMTVDPATARFHTEREGKTFWFCAAGCLAAFEASHRQG